MRTATAIAHNYSDNVVCTNNMIIINLIHFSIFKFIVLNLCVFIQIYCNYLKGTNKD